MVYRTLADLHNNRPLHTAARRGDTKILSYMINHNFARVNDTDHDKTTALHYAARYGNTETARELIRLSADVNSTNNHGITPLSEAVGNAQTDTARAFIQLGAITTFNNATTILHAMDTPRLHLS